MPFLRTSYATPGVIAGPTTAERDWLETVSTSPHNSPPVYLSAGRIIDGTKARDPGHTGDVDVLRPGLLMGRITTGGKYANAIIGAVATAAASGATALTATPAAATELVRRVGATGTFNLTGPPSAAGTVATQVATYSAVNVTTGVVTVTALAAAYIAGSFIRPTDGSQTIKGGLDQFVKVTNDSGTGQDTQMSHLCVSAYAKSTQIIDWPSDTSLQTWMKAQLNDPTNGPGPFRFTDNF